MQKKTKAQHKLTVARETVRKLGAAELMHVEGGSGAHQGQLTWKTVIDPSPTITLH